MCGRDLMRLIKRTGLLGTAFALAWLTGCGGGTAAAELPASAGGNAYVAVPEANAVASYRVSTGSGNLKAVLGSPFSGGTSPISIAVHPSGKFVYTANQGGNDISLYTVNSNTGELTEVLPRTPAGLESHLVGSWSSGGDLLFVANQTSNTISVYYRQFERWHFDRGRGIALRHRFAAGSAGLVSFGKISVRGEFEIFPWYSAIPSLRGRAALLAIPGSPFTVGNGPSFAGDRPLRKHFLYVTNFIDNTVSGLSIDSTSGALTDSAGFSLRRRHGSDLGHR